MRVIEVEDEHAEARFVAAEIAALIDGGLSASEIAVFYRMNAQSRVLEDVLVRQDVPYQVIGGPRFYERAEIRDATAYLSVLVNPQDATSLLRIANRPRRGIGDTSMRASWPMPRTPADALPGDGRSGGRGGLGRIVPGDPRVPRDDGVAHGAVAGAPRGRAPRARPREVRHDRGARGGADDRGARADREPAGARRRRAGVPPAGRGSDRWPASSRTSRSSPTRTRSATSAGSSR